MNHFLKRSFSAMMCVCILAGSATVSVGSADILNSNNQYIVCSHSEKTKEQNSIDAVMSDKYDTNDAVFSDPVEVVFVNPLYGDMLDESDLPKAPPARAAFDISECLSFDDAAAYLRSKMKLREDQIDVKLKYAGDKFASNNDINRIVKLLMDSALEHTGVPDEGDYIAYQYGGYRCSVSYAKVSSEYYFLISYALEYYSTAEQERRVNAVIDKLIDDLDIDKNESDYENLEKIYDWICENVEYDYDNLYDNEYLLKHTAYAALINGKSVCQGYAALLYRLALEVGVDARYIAGIGNGGPHGWNIVRLGDKYYNVDATWDAVYKQANFDYMYFLRADSTFEGHVRDSEYLTEDFVLHYPMSDRDFEFAHTHVYGEWILIQEANCVDAGIEECICTICGEKKKRNTDLGDHMWCEWETVTEPTESASGLRRRNCSVCGKLDEDIINPLIHTHKYTVSIVSPTCTEKGYTVHTCKCGDSFTDEYVDALGHDFTDTVSAPTCAVNGYTTHTCIRCAHSYTDSNTAALGHIFGEDWTVDVYPTRDTEGLRHRACKRCGSRDEQAVEKLQNSSLIFSDIAVDWYKPSVDYALTHSLMDGKGNGKFAPDENMTRAQFATVLWRIANKPESNVSVPFTDLDRDAGWYLTAVAWAYENGIINGTSPETFDPNGNIKRQDMAVILHRYAEKYMAYDVTASADLSSFPDSDSIGGYAVAAISWTNALGIITGKNGYIAPSATGTRAEVATILMRFDLIH